MGDTTNHIYMQTEMSASELVSIAFSGSTYEIYFEDKSKNDFRAKNEEMVVHAYRINIPYPGPGQSYYIDGLGFIPNMRMGILLKGEIDTDRMTIYLPEDKAFEIAVHLIKKIQSNLAYAVPFNGEYVAIQRVSGQIVLNEDLHKFNYWTPQRLAILDMPYQFKVIGIDFY